MDDELAAFVRDAWPRLVRTAYLITGRRSSAEDLVQAALVKTLGAWRRGGPPANAEAYVRTVMVRQAVRWRARLSNSELAFGDPPDTVAVDPTAGLAEAAAVREALRRLPVEQRAVLVLRYWDQRSEVEIAEMLRVSPGTVKSRASRALAVLRADDLIDITKAEVNHD